MQTFPVAPGAYTIDGATITFRMSDRCSVDHFLDRLEEDKLCRLEDTMPGEKKAAVNLLAHRDRWMASELYNLFQGGRYVCMEGTINLRQGGKIITDIDAAVFDITTGELGLFQLKWQDFSSNDVAKQRSNAKNFVEKVDAWARSVQGWLAEFGTESPSAVASHQKRIRHLADSPLRARPFGGAISRFTVTCRRLTSLLRQRGVSSRDCGLRWVRPRTY